MGRKFSFFLSSSDQQRFNSFLLDVDDSVFFNSRPNYPEAQILDSSASRESHRVLVGRRSDLSNIRFISISGCSDFSSDVSSQPFIEFDRSHLKAKCLWEGRLYRTDRFWDENGEISLKSEDFVRWADRLFRIAKKSLTKIESGFYAGDEAIEMRKNGIAFVQLDLSIGQAMAAYKAEHI